MDEYNLSLTTEEEIESRYGLKADFYRAHKFRRYDWDGSNRMTAYKPLAMARRESQCSEYIRVQYRDRWYVIISLGKGMNGPHPVKLYTSLDGYDEAIWLGTCQFTGNFYNDRGLRKQLKQAILGKEYFASDDSDEEEFVIVASECLREIEGQAQAQLPLSTCFQTFRVIYLPLGYEKCKPRCPKCKITTKTYHQLERHYERAHHKKLYVFRPKPLDKCPPL